MKPKVLLFIFIAFIIVVGIAIVWMFWPSHNPETPKLPGVVQTPTEKPAETPTGQVKQKGILDKVLKNPNTRTAVLNAVDGSSSSGTAYRLVENGKLFVAVAASLRNPAKGNVYEGWIVQLSPLRFLPIGVLEQQKEGEWVVEFVPEVVPTFTTEGFPTFTTVVITEETVVDNIPETHILEGKF